jgi:t-SNARE complex subunit (syntaxin)
MDCNKPTIDCVVEQFNKDYPLLEKNVKHLILKNKRLRIYIYILICIIIAILIAYLVMNQLNK